jgi:iron complex outermembrane recepter protein
MFSQKNKSMKSWIFHLLLFFGWQQVVHAQVSGKLLTATGQPVPFANVLLLKAVDTSIVKTTLSDEQGRYQLSGPGPGKYMLRLASMGYESWDSPVFELTVSQPQKDFEALVLKATARRLDAVTVQATKPLYEQQAAGIVVNVENSLLTKGSSVLALLERSPGVTIDYRNNSIALNGKSGVAVMLNGKLLRLPLDQVVGLLTGMSGNDVGKIDLLTTPGAKYDAEGSAGIINIVLKKNRQPGMNGSLAVTGGYGKGEKGMGSIRLSRNTGNSNLYGSYSFSHNRTYSDMYIDSDQDMPVFGGQMNVLGWDTAKVVQNNHDVSLGFDKNLTPKVLIGASVSYNSSSASSATVNRAIYHLLPDSLLHYAGAVNGMNRWRNVVAAVYIEKEMREGEKVNVDVDYLFFKNSNPSVVQSIFLDKAGATAGNNDPLFSPQQRGFANTAIHVAVAKADYTKALSKKMQLAAGVKGTYTKSNSSSRIESLIDQEWVDRVETAQDIMMKEAIGAAYATVTTQINPALTLILGARYEYANTRISDPVTGKNTLNRRQGVLFPEISLSKKLSEASAWQLSYSKRISRPSYNDLASYVTYSDPTAVYTGNPLLQPTITHNVKVGYNYKGYTFSLLFNRDEHPIARYQLTEKPAANLLYVSPQNLLYQNNITLQVNLPWKVTDWWSMDYGFTGGLRQYKLDYTRKPVEHAYFGYSLNFNESFKLPEDFTMELSGWYNSSSYNGSIKVGALGALNAGVKKELKNNWGSIQLAWTDILRTVRINVYYGTLTEEAFAIKNHVAIRTESSAASVLKLTYTKSFGSGVKGRGKRDTGSKDEGERIRKE